MREALLILPNDDNSGASLIAVHAELRRRLCATFGGYTGQECFGGYKDFPEEPGIAYTIACENSLQSCSALLAIARWLRAEARQEAIYLRQPSGEVQYIVAT